MRTSTFTPDQKKIQIAEMLNNYYTVKDEYIKAIVTTAPKVIAIQALLLFKHITMHQLAAYFYDVNIKNKLLRESL